MNSLAWTIAVFALAWGGMAVVNALVWKRIRPASSSEGAPRISVLIPARNEEAHLPACLASVLAAPAEEVAEILVYDDGSTDTTAEVVTEHAARDPRVRLLPGVPLPEGWCGKPHALVRLAEQATGEGLLFLDADTRLAPGGAAGIAKAAAALDADLLSAWPGIEIVGPAEQWLMPMLNWVVLSSYPTPLQFRRGDAFLGLAHGACLYAKATTYRALGGHGAVRAEVFEDTALARAFRAAGRRAYCLDGQAAARVRMYDSLAAIWRGFKKNARTGFRHETSFWLFQLAHVAVGVVPFVALPLAAVTGAPVLPWAVAAASLLLGRLALALRFHQPMWSVLLHPAGETMLVALGLASWSAVRSGRGLEWKGRVYAGRSQV